MIFLIRQDCGVRWGSQYHGNSCKPKHGPPILHTALHGAYPDTAVPAKVRESNECQKLEVSERLGLVGSWFHKVYQAPMEEGGEWLNLWYSNRCHGLFDWVRHISTRFLSFEQLFREKWPREEAQRFHTVHFAERAVNESQCCSYFQRNITAANSGQVNPVRAEGLHPSAWLEPYWWQAYHASRIWNIEGGQKVADLVRAWIPQSKSSCLNQSHVRSGRKNDPGIRDFGAGGRFCTFASKRHAGSSRRSVEILMRSCCLRWKLSSHLRWSSFWFPLWAKKQRLTNGQTLQAYQWCF